MRERGREGEREGGRGEGSERERAESDVGSYYRTVRGE